MHITDRRGFTAFNASGHISESSGETVLTNDSVCLWLSGWSFAHKNQLLTRL